MCIIKIKRNVDWKSKKCVDPFATTSPSRFQSIGTLWNLWPKSINEGGSSTGLQTYRLPQRLQERSTFLLCFFLEIYFNILKYKKFRTYWKGRGRPRNSKNSPKTSTSSSSVSPPKKRRAPVKRRAPPKRKKKKPETESEDEAEDIVSEQEENELEIEQGN